MDDGWCLFVANNNLEKSSARSIFFVTFYEGSPEIRIRHRPSFDYRETPITVRIHLPPLNTQRTHNVEVWE